MKNPKQIIMAALGAFMLLVFLFITPKIWETVDANEIVVIQAPWSGQLDVYTEPGTVWQNLGKVTRYKRSFQYWFDGNEEHDGAAPIPVKFYDGGHAAIPGSIRVDLPLDKESIKAFHIKYSSQQSIENDLIGQVLIKSVNMSGPTMTSKESYAEKKNDLLYIVEDQAIHGVYKTHQKDVKTVDPLSGQERMMVAVEILNDATGKPLRQESSAIAEMKIRLSNLSFGDFAYDTIVRTQIAVQQKATMDVQTAIANAKRAEQDAITVEQQGKANAATAKWEQEVIKARQVTQAQQELEVQRLATQTAELYKKQQILEGEGEAAKRKLIMTADGALDKKLAAWVEERKAAWKAFGEFQGSMVPTYYSGGAAGNMGNATNWVEIMGMNAMHQLGLNLSQK